MHNKPHSEETKLKMSRSNARYWLGKKRPAPSEETKKKMSESAKGRSSPMLGKHHTIESKEKSRLSHLGRKANENQLRGLSLGRGWNKGNKGLFKHTEEIRKKIIKNFLPYQEKGEKHPLWKGGQSRPLHVGWKYNQWRKKVFERDDYRCFDCGQRGGKLEADHILRFSDYPRLRFEVLNGQTLCKKCHKQKTRFERIGIYSF